MIISPKISEAYFCPTCNKVSLNLNVIDKCIDRHLKIEESEKKKRPIEKFIKDNYIDYFKNSLIKKDSSISFSWIRSIGEALVSTAEIFGHTLIINKILTKIDNKRDSSISIKISGQFFRTENWEFPYEKLSEKGILKKDFLRVIKNHKHINKLIFDTYGYVFSDLVSAIGLETYSESGFRTFSSEILLDLKDFPDSLKEISEFYDLQKKRKKYIAEKSRLKAIYDEERLPSVLVSDINYAIMSSDLEALEKKKILILEEMNLLSEKMSLRKEELIMGDCSNIPIPDSTHDYDEERYSMMSEYFIL